MGYPVRSDASSTVQVENVACKTAYRSPCMSWAKELTIEEICMMQTFVKAMFAGEGKTLAMLLLVWVQKLTAWIIVRQVAPGRVSLPL